MGDRDAEYLRMMGWSSGHFARRLWPLLLLGSTLSACDEADDSYQYPTQTWSQAGAPAVVPVVPHVPAAPQTPYVPPAPAKPAVDSPAGEWGLFGFEDMVGVSFSGPAYGCYVGLNPDANDRTCGTVQVLEGDGRHFKFALTFEAGQIHVYASDVFLSDDGKRLGGSFGTGSSIDDIGWRHGYAWLPLDTTLPPDVGQTGIRWLKQTRAPLAPPVQTSAAFTLESDDAGLGELTADGVYYWSPHTLMSSGNSSVTGDFGAYWDTELHWDDATQTLSGGPVAATAPHLPTAFSVHFANGMVKEASVSTPEGGKYRLVPVVR